ncbi:hypothetical protein [Paraburkholderia heleia]|uniref:hypothetical protein n=1 Tax=Paraburkholderia heleia TaxID=634127 RepID=UPI0031D6F53C
MRYRDRMVRVVAEASGHAQPSNPSSRMDAHRGARSSGVTAALLWIDAEASYEITAKKVLDAHAALTDVTSANGISRNALNARLRDQFWHKTTSSFVGKLFAPHIGGSAPRERLPSLVTRYGDNPPTADYR